MSDWTTSRPVSEVGEKSEGKRAPGRISFWPVCAFLLLPYGKDQKSLSQFYGAANLGRLSSVGVDLFLDGIKATAKMVRDLHNVDISTVRYLSET